VAIYEFSPIPARCQRGLAAVVHQISRYADGL
jgi:hypothetical protein